MDDARSSPALPSYLLDARKLYKQSTAVVIDWLAANGATKSGKAARSGVKGDVNRERNPVVRSDYIEAEDDCASPYPLRVRDSIDQ